MHAYMHTQPWCTAKETTKINDATVFFFCCFDREESSRSLWRRGGSHRDVQWKVLLHSVFCTSIITNEMVMSVGHLAVCGMMAWHWLHHPLSWLKLERSPVLMQRTIPRDFWRLLFRSLLVLPFLLLVILVVAIIDVVDCASSDRISLSILFPSWLRLRPCEDAPWSEWRHNSAGQSITGNGWIDSSRMLSRRRSNILDLYCCTSSPSCPVGVSDVGSFLVELSAMSVSSSLQLPIFVEKRRESAVSNASFFFCTLHNTFCCALFWFSFGVVARYPFNAPFSSFPFSEFVRRCALVQCLFFFADVARCWWVVTLDNSLRHQPTKRFHSMNLYA